MTNRELENKIRELADQCDESRNQQAVKATLLVLLGAMASGRELALLNHAAPFAENEIKRLAAARN